MKLTDRIRNMAEQIEVQDIAISLGLPVELVEGVINGTVDESTLKDYDPASKVTVVDKHIITRGHILAVLQSAPLAAEIALYLSSMQPTAVIDLERYSNLPIHIGMEIYEIPQSVNILWDEFIDQKEYRKNLFVYTLPNPKNINLIDSVFNYYPIVVLNLPAEQLEKILPIVNILYLPVSQDNAGVHKAYQVISQNKPYEEKVHLIWITKQNDNKYLSIVRNFSNVHIAGYISEGQYQKHIPKIMESLFPANRKKIFGIF